MAASEWVVKSRGTETPSSGPASTQVRICSPETWNVCSFWQYLVHKELDMKWFPPVTDLYFIANKKQIHYKENNTGDAMVIFTTQECEYSPITFLKCTITFFLIVYIIKIWPILDRQNWTTCIQQPTIICLWEENKNEKIIVGRTATMSNYRHFKIILVKMSEKSNRITSNMI